MISQFSYMKGVLNQFTPYEFVDSLSESMWEFTSRYLKRNIDSRNKVIALRPYLTSLTRSERSISILKTSLNKV